MLCITIAYAPPRRESSLLSLACIRKKGYIKDQLYCIVLSYLMTCVVIDFRQQRCLVLSYRCLPSSCCATSPLVRPLSLGPTAGPRCTNAVALVVRGAALPAATSTSAATVTAVPATPTQTRDITSRPVTKVSQLLTSNCHYAS